MTYSAHVSCGHSQAALFQATRGSQEYSVLCSLTLGAGYEEFRENKDFTKDKDKVDKFQHGID